MAAATLTMPSIRLSAPIDKMQWLGPHWMNPDGLKVGHATLTQREWLWATTDTILYADTDGLLEKTGIPVSEPVLTAGPTTSVRGTIMTQVVGGWVQRDLFRQTNESDFALNAGIEIVEVGTKHVRTARRPRTLTSTRIPMPDQKNRFTDVCLIDAIRVHGVRIPYGEDGPFWALRDGNRMLNPFGLMLQPKFYSEMHRHGRYVVNTGGHFEAMMVDREGCFIWRGGGWRAARFSDTDSPFSLPMCLTDHITIHSGWRFYQLVPFSTCTGCERLDYAMDCGLPYTGMADDSRGGADPVRAVLDRWEPASIGRLVRRRSELILHVDREDEPETMRAAVERVEAAVQAEIQKWELPCPRDLATALKVVGYLVTEWPHIRVQNDVLITCLAAIMLRGDYAAHPEGVYRYAQGAFRRVEELGESTLRQFDSLIHLSAKVLRAAMVNNLGCGLQELMADLEGLSQDILTSAAVLSSDIRPPRSADFAQWALDLCKGLSTITPCFTNRAAAKQLYEEYGAWMSTPYPLSNRVTITFDDSTIEVLDDLDDPHRVVQIPKSKDNMCYFGIPGCFVPEPADDVVEKLRLMLCTSYAGAADGRDIDMAYEALGLMGQTLPPVVLWYRGNGGNAKSARTILRSNTFSSHHAILAAECMQLPEAFRKEGGQVAYARAITIQECDPGKPMEEQVFKTWVSGERRQCRPLFGKTTQYYRWSKCLKYWETNLTLPSIKGDPDRLDNLRSFLRRIVTIHLQAEFSSDPDKENVQGMVFREDATLSEFLDSDEVRFAYLRTFLFPFIQEHTAAECRQLVLNPPAHLVMATRKLVGQMANGGIEEWSGLCTLQEEQAAIAEARDLVIQAHSEAGGRHLVKTYDVAKVMKSLPGVYKSSRTNTSKTKCEHLELAVQKWPHLIYFDPPVKGFHLLRVDFAKLDSLLTRDGYDHYGGGFASWRPVWDCKALLEAGAGDPLGYDDDFQEPTATDTYAGSLTEWVNITALRDAMDNDEIVNAAHRDRIQAVIDRFSAAPREGNFALATISYYRKHGMPGRRYAYGASSQREVPSMHRRIALAKEPESSAGAGFVFLDFDIDNCYVTLLCNQLEVAISDLNDYATLLALRTHYREWRQLLSDYYGISVSKKAAKKMLIRLVHHAVPQNDLPFLWNLSVEVRAATDQVLALPEFMYLQGMFGNRRHPMATRLHYALANVEDGILQDVETALTSRIPAAAFNTYMFDGAVVRVPTAAIPEVNAVLTEVGARNKVSFSVEQLDSVGGSEEIPSRCTRRFVTPLEFCRCGKKLRQKASRPTKATLYGFDGAEEVQHIRKRCKCGATYNYNYQCRGGAKVNTVRLADVDALFVNPKVAFSTRFLRYHIRLHFRGFVSAQAIEWAGNGCLWIPHCVPHRWTESYCVARSVYMAMLEFDCPALQRFLKKIKIGEAMPVESLDALDEHMHASVFPPCDPSAVDIISMDGHEKVLMRACAGGNACTKRAGRPRVRKTKRGNRHTCGWMMATDPRTGRVLGVEEQKVPENNEVKKRCLSKIMPHYPQVDALIHDRNCSFKPDCERCGLFTQIKFWPIDKWHGAKHRIGCPCRPQSNRRLARRLRGVNSSCSEQVFSWFRCYARTINEMNPDRHRLAVLHYCRLHNALVDNDDTGHLNAFSANSKSKKALRKRPATSYAC